MAEPEKLIAGRYLLGDFVGQGGMSTVYRGTDTKLGRQVAIKIMKADLAGDQTFRDRFKSEAKAASRMAHPTIVRVLDAGEQEFANVTAADPKGNKSIPYIVMEYVEGQDLRQLMAKGAIGQAEACMVVEDVLTALEYSHKAGVIHRDIKPANIMITTTGQVKVMDFGIARAISESSSSLHQTTAILGTAAYFSPEQAKGDPLDTRTDLYSTGVMLYEMLAGQVPFTGDSAVAVAYQHVSEKPVSARERNRKVTPELDRVVMKALAKDKNRRYQSASEFREYLREAAAGNMPDFDDEPAALETLFGLEGAPVEDVYTSESSFGSRAIALLAPGPDGWRSLTKPPKVYAWGGLVLATLLIVFGMFWAASVAGSVNPVETRVVPELAGMTEADAKRELADLDLTMISVQEANDDFDKGRVIRSDPKPGARINSGDSVRVFVSKGRSTVDVPDVELLSLADATAAIEAAGLKLGEVSTQDHPSIAADVVISVDPTSGEAVKPESAVNLVVSTGMVTVPDVKGQSTAVARDLLQQLQLSVDLRPDAGCAQQPNSPVNSQSIIGQQKQNSKITLTYCAG